ncbi:MAG: cation-translocating P-type ATPase [Candidatus Nanohaloarchaea archaeon]|nr:cation-translocating P-type ATPase [Candidatus Nanohaloarchaea archaeon]
MPDQEWHSQDLEAVYEEWGTSGDGLSSAEAARRLEEHGENAIQSGHEVHPIQIFIDQFRDFLIWILFAAAGVSMFLGKVVDAALIGLILVANGVFGFLQDYKAEESIAALKKMSSSSARVERGGKKREIDSRNVVPGDIVYLEAGDSVPADARLISQESLKVNESALTGESVGVDKEEQVLDADTPLAERRNMVYKNTVVERGTAKAVVVATGMETEVGKIATSIQESEDRETPFQREVNVMGKKIGIGVLAISAIVALVEFTVGNSQPIDILLASIGLAVAAVPEGLPAVVTLALALGAKKMVDKSALVRRLPVVESLGSVDVICTDKTGTLTEDRMTVRKLYHGGKEYDVTGGGYSEEGRFLYEDEEVEPDEFAELLRCGVLCNNAERGVNEEGEETFLGDPTEISLLVSGTKAGFEKEELNEEEPRVGEVSFTSGRKRMTVVREREDGQRAYMKGAPEVVLERCDRIKIDGEVKELTDERREEVLDRNNQFAEQALRVLGFAYKDDPDGVSEDIEEGFVFLGLQGMIDPPRAKVKDAIKDCRDAGIRVVMVTGDNRMTAKVIGGKLGFADETAYTGSEIEAMSDEELISVIEDDGVEIFARVSPEHKSRILELLQDNDHIVAMTGDGVNDAPAVKKADVGISMGERGTDVTEQASDMVLLDDNFVTIRDAIAEGRGIFDNIRKFVNYLLSANAGEVLLVFLGSISGLGLVLTAVQLLWINFLTDGLPALALGVDPKSDEIMDRQPRSSDTGVITDRMLTSIGGIGLLIAACILPLFYINRGNLALAQTTAFTALVVFELVRVQAIRSRYELGLFSNHWLLLALAVSFLLQLVVLYSPLGQFFGVVPLAVKEWLEIGGSLVAFTVLTAILVTVEDHVFEDRH